MKHEKLKDRRGLGEAEGDISFSFPGYHFKLGARAPMTLKDFKGGEKLDKFGKNMLITGIIPLVTLFVIMAMADSSFAADLTPDYENGSVENVLMSSSTLSNTCANDYFTGITISFDGTEDSSRLYSKDNSGGSAVGE